MDAAVEITPVALPASTTPPSPSQSLRQFLSLTLPPVLVLAAALVVAGLDYVHFLSHHRQLWTGTIHDRHAHYLTALRLALDVRHADLVQGLHDFDQARVWPPLHALLAAAVLAVGGPDYRLAVLPSLLAFVGTVLLGFLVARRAAPRGGNFAGLMAALLILSSTPHRAFATDVMLESLGACLSLLVLYLYLLTVQNTSKRMGRCLGLALTALFLAKYNYWALVVGGLIAAELTTRPRIYRRLLAEALASLDLRRVLAVELRRPLNYLFVLVGALLVCVLLGGTTLALGPWRLSLHSPHNLVLTAYALFLLRIALAWLRHRHAILACLDVRARPLLAWHFGPVALWFLLPARLSWFLWYFSPAQTGEGPRYPLAHSVEFYWNCWIDNYSSGVPMALLLLGLVGVTALVGRRLRPGGRVLVCFVLVAVVLCLLHPNRKSRFLHTWIAGVWTSAGVGLVCVTHGRLTHRIPATRPWLATAALAGLGAACLPSLAQAARAPEGGPNPERLSCRDLTDCYLPSLADSRHAAVFSNLPMKFLCRWTFLERHGPDRRLETEIHDFTPTAPDVFAHWLATTNCDTVVFVDVARQSCFYEHVPACDRYEPLRELLENQIVFVRTERWQLPQHGCTVTVWKRPRPE